MNPGGSAFARKRRWAAQSPSHAIGVSGDRTPACASVRRWPPIESDNRPMRAPRQSVAFVEWLAVRYPTVGEIAREHMDDNGQLLPHIMFGMPPLSWTSRSTPGSVEPPQYPGFGGAAFLDSGGRSCGVGVDQFKFD